jgi:hypothetical protein
VVAAAACFHMAVAFPWASIGRYSICGGDNSRGSTSGAKGDGMSSHGMHQCGILCIMGGGNWHDGSYSVLMCVYASIDDMLYMQGYVAHICT